MKKVSVFIPCRNEVKNIQNCVESILASDYGSLEVIVVDGMSDDGTRDVLGELEKKYENVRMVDNPHKLTPYAFNLGVQNATGEYIQISGSRNVMAKDYISKMVEVLETKPDVACVGGDYQHEYENETGRYISYAMESKFGVGASNYRTMSEDCYVDTVGVPMYRREIFDEIGFFDERLTRNQDDDFNYRVTQKGHKIFYRSDAKVKYYVRGSFLKAFKQFGQYGYFKVFVNKKHKAITTKRQMVPALFVVFLIGGAVLACISDLMRSLYVSVMVLYWALGLCFSMYFSKKLPEVLKIQYAIFILHLGYGLGYLRGILDFIVLRKSPSKKMQVQTT